MIRVWVEGEQQAIFGDFEKVTICREVYDGEYIEGERHEKAWELERRWFRGDKIYQYIFLDKNDFALAVRHGTPNNWYEGIFLIVKVEKLPNQLPSFIERPA